MSALTLTHEFADLGAPFSAPVAPSAAVAPQELIYNAALADALGLDLEPAERTAWLSGASVPEGAQPVAQAYAGHQFGHFNPQLGDGRAILLGELQAPDGRVLDLHLKGAGRTPFSRNGDGQAWVGPVLRELIVSESVHALGVPTSRVLSTTATGAPVRREDVFPGAVVARIASSHVRVGTFEFFAARRNTEALRTLVDFAIKRHDADLLRESDPAERTVAFYGQVVERTLALVAHWMRVGFIHGVMNTDNVAVSGETIDFGPCAFMDTYSADKVFSSIDRGGRYRYVNQPPIAKWNLAVLAQCLLPLVSDDEDAAVERLGEVVAGFDERFNALWLQAFAPKLGLRDADEADRALIHAFLDRMESRGEDFTLAFRRLRSLPDDGDAFSEQWHARLRAGGDPDDVVQERIRLANPAVIARNHQVERAIQASLAGDLSVARALLDAVRDPFSAAADDSPFAEPPDAHEVVKATFCGT